MSFARDLSDLQIDTVVMYTRAAASDYDDWETKYHNPGWSSTELVPLLRKVSFKIS